MSKNPPHSDSADSVTSSAEWKALVAEHQESNLWRANWQLLNSVGGYAALWALMYLSLSVSWWLTMGLALLSGALLVRIFIIFHDCGHGSFFKSNLANNVWGFLTGVLTFTPYYHWRWEHSRHHATSGNLDRRGLGDIWTLTVEEYRQASPGKKFSYRLARNPLILFFAAPLIIFVVRQRFSLSSAKPREKNSVRMMNLAILAFSGTLIAFFGFLPWLIIQLTILAIGGGGGLWLFYVQHQFEGAYWERNESWDYTDAAMKGSSFYKLPRILQWISGNIGFHHIHHLSSRIPNYNLERCHRSDPAFSNISSLTFWTSLKSLKYRLWDEEAGKLVGYGHLKQFTKRPASASDL
jgi:omega-6 fatty acid desaturase (delta-12 desaturase)